MFQWILGSEMWKSVKAISEILDKQNNKKQKGEKMGTYEVKKSGDGVMFNLKAGNGEVIGTSEIYNSRESLDTGIASVRKNAATAPVEDQTTEGFEQMTCPKFEVFTDKSGKTRFRLKARNGEIILASQGYASKQNCLAGIESVKANVAGAVVSENT